MLNVRRVMKSHFSNQEQRALTRVEVLVVVVVAVFFMGLLLLPFTDSVVKVKRINCFSNLKAGECAFRLWGDDNNNQYPMELSTNYGGAREWVLAGNAAEVFRVMSNELSTPKILFCPADNRVCATNWSQFDNRHLSYFVGVDAPCPSNTNIPTARRSLFLYGDRNLTNDTRPENGIVQLAPSAKVRWTTGMHKNRGNVCLANGTVLTINDAALGEILRTNSFATNRLAIP
jgi:hypothetical protein